MNGSQGSDDSESRASPDWKRVLLALRIFLEDMPKKLINLSFLPPSLVPKNFCGQRVWTEVSHSSKIQLVRMTVTRLLVSAQ